MTLRVVVVAGLLLAGCAIRGPAPEACYRVLAGMQPFPMDHGQWWNQECAGRMVGHGYITDSEVPRSRHLVPAGRGTWISY